MAERDRNIYLRILHHVVYGDTAQTSDPVGTVMKQGGAVVTNTKLEERVMSGSNPLVEEKASLTSVIPPGTLVFNRSRAVTTTSSRRT